MEHECERKASTREKILNATLSIMGKEGLHKVTIKKIANMAQVNIAAVNYHFGSKDNVIDEATKILTQKLKSCFELLDDKRITPEERLRNFLRCYSAATLEYPDVLRNFVNHSINNYDTPVEYVRFIKEEGLPKIKNTLREAGAEEDDEALFMKCFQLVSAMEFPILLGKQMEYFSGISYHCGDIRDKYIELLIKTAF